MELENRYMVLKLKDVKELPAHLLNQLDYLSDAIRNIRDKRKASALECLVIEKDWPEYEPALAMLSARVDGNPFEEIQNIPRDFLERAKHDPGEMFHYYVNFSYLDGKFQFYCDGLNHVVTEEAAEFTQRQWGEVPLKLNVPDKPGPYGKAIREALEPFNEAATVVKHSHYKKDIRHLNMLDVYRVLQLFNVTDSAIQHAVKKLLVAGGRGAGKDRERDYREAVDSINRALQMIAEDDAADGSKFEGRPGGL